MIFGCHFSGTSLGFSIVDTGVETGIDAASFPGASATVAITHSS
jgi:hypothetical protein